MASAKKTIHTKKIVLIVLMTLVVLLLVCVLAAWLLVKSYLNKIDYDHGSLIGSNETESTLSKEEILEELLEEDAEGGASNSPQEDIEQLESQMKEQVKDQEGEPEIFSSDDIYNMLVVGCDSRKKGGAGRSDAMILVSINRETKKIHTTSIMRDCYVSIPDNGNNRINAAYAFGGGSLLLDTVENNFAVEVDKYIAFDFYSFSDVVDSIGGIDVKLSDAELEVLNGYVRDLNGINKNDLDKDILKESGLVHLNGKQALAYARIRHVGNGDFERTERQRTVISKIFEKAKTMNLLELNDLLNVILPEIKTNLTENEILEHVLKVSDYLEYEMDSLRIPVDDSYKSMRVNDMAVLGIDLKKNQNALVDFITN